MRNQTAIGTLASIVLIAATVEAASITVFVNAGPQAGATGGAAWGRADQDSATALPGFPPCPPGSIATCASTGPDVRFAAAHGTASDAHLGAYALAKVVDAMAQVTFSDQVLINSPITIDVDLRSSLGTAVPSAPNPEAAAFANVSMLFELNVPNPFFGTCLDGICAQPTIPVAARRIDVFKAHDGISISQDGYTVSDLQAIVEQGNSSPNFIRHTFVFDPDPTLNPFIFFLPPPVTFGVRISLTSTAECIDECSATANAYDTASVRLTGDYVSLGAVTYQGLADTSGTVPEPATWGLVMLGVTLAAARGLRKR